MYALEDELDCHAPKMLDLRHFMKVLVDFDVLDNQCSHVEVFAIYQKVSKAKYRYLYVDG